MGTFKTNSPILKTYRTTRRSRLSTRHLGRITERIVPRRQRRCLHNFGWVILAWQFVRYSIPFMATYCRTNPEEYGCKISSTTAPHLLHISGLGRPRVQIKTGTFFHTHLQELSIGQVSSHMDGTVSELNFSQYSLYLRL